MNDDPKLDVDDTVWLIGYLADNAPADLLIPPRLASMVRLCRMTYSASSYTVAVPIDSTRYVSKYAAPQPQETTT